MKISIVVTYLPVDNEEVRFLTEECLHRIKNFTHYPHELIFISNGQTLYGEEANVKVQNRENLGNGKAWDQGVGVSSEDFVILMDNDVWVERDWDKELIDKLSDKTIGITFPYSIVGDGLNRRNSGFDVSYKGRRDGFCFAFRKDVYDEVGPFLCDQPFKLGYYEDDWFEYRVQYLLGLKLVSCPNSRVWHKSQGTTKKVWSQEIINGIEANKRWYEDKTKAQYPYLN